MTQPPNTKQTRGKTNRMKKVIWLSIVGLLAVWNAGAEESKECKQAKLDASKATVIASTASAVCAKAPYAVPVGLAVKGAACATAIVQGEKAITKLVEVGVKCPSSAPGSASAAK